MLREVEDRWSEVKQKNGGAFQLRVQHMKIDFRWWCWSTH